MEIQKNIDKINLAAGKDGEESRSIILPLQKTLNRRKSLLIPDQPIPTLPDEELALNDQQVIRSLYELQADMGFDFCQSSRAAAIEDEHEPDI